MFSTLSFLWLLAGSCVPLVHSQDTPVTVKEFNQQFRTNPWRVMYGSNAAVGQFPFVVSLSGCTASLINANTVLTAAHCVCSGQTKVTAAVTHTWQSTPQMQVKTVSQIYSNPKHVQQTGKCMAGGAFDTAIIKLRDGFQFNANVQPINKVHCGSAPPPAGTAIINVGYGRSSTTESGILRYGHNTLISPCNAAPPGYICSDLRDRSGKILNVVAPGDSGGPVVQVLGNRQWMQIGVNSAANAERGFYAPTASNCDWLRQYVTLP